MLMLFVYLLNMNISLKVLLSSLVLEQLVHCTWYREDNMQSNEVHHSQTEVELRHINA